MNMILLISGISLGAIALLISAFLVFKKFAATQD